MLLNFGFSSLGFPWRLDFGAWNFRHGSPEPVEQARHVTVKRGMTLGEFSERRNAACSFCIANPAMLACLSPQPAAYYASV
jgi:hypothetical protein